MQDKYFMSKIIVYLSGLRIYRFFKEFLIVQVYKLIK